MIGWNNWVASCDAVCGWEGWSGCDSRCCVQSGGTVGSRAAMLRVDGRAGRVATCDAACNRVEWSGRASQLQGHALCAIGLRAESWVMMRLGLGWSVLLGAWPACDRVWG